MTRKAQLSHRDFEISRREALTASKTGCFGVHTRVIGRKVIVPNLSGKSQKPPLGLGSCFEMPALDRPVPSHSGARSVNPRAPSGGCLRAMVSPFSCPHPSVSMPVSSSQYLPPSISLLPSHSISLQHDTCMSSCELPSSRTRRHNTPPRDQSLLRRFRPCPDRAL